MVIGISEDFSQSLPLLNIYSSARPKYNLWAIASFQFALCLVTSLFLPYVFFIKFHFGGNKAWTTAITVSNPIRKRLQILEKEGAIWKYYLHWMEDYFFVYWAILKFLNKTTLDMDKSYKDQVFGLSQITSSVLRNDSVANVSMISGNRSDLSLESVASEDDLQLITSLARVLAQMTAEDTEKRKSDNVKPIYDPGNLYASDVTSGDETNEESNENESESIPVAHEEELNGIELMDMDFLREDNNLIQDGLFVISD